eukprot:maker-scaffold_40-snap-gene-2.65-mRNA-1 protein AED:0.26 eAED:0.26 QI:118/1/1/1/1/1/4/256/314
MKNLFNTTRYVLKKPLRREIFKSFSNLSNDKTKISFVGGGRMAEALIGNLHKKHEIAVLEPNESRRNVLSTQYPNVNIFSYTTEEEQISFYKDTNALVLATKPQSVESYFKHYSEIKEEVMLTKNPIFLSVCAGITIKKLIEGFGSNNVVRVMPNTPATIGKGMSVWISHPKVSSDNNSLCKSILSTLGVEHQVFDEEYLDMATAISGSGPAYIFLMIESMIESAVHIGMPRDVAQILVQETIQGSLEYFKQSEKHPALLRNEITSPGGTTAAAAYTLEQGGFRSVMSDAIWSAYQRSRELGGKSTQVGPNAVR